jgi:hypothetical protein
MIWANGLAAVIEGCVEELIVEIKDSIGVPFQVDPMPGSFAYKVPYVATLPIQFPHKWVNLILGKSIQQESYTNSTLPAAGSPAPKKPSTPPIYHPFTSPEQTSPTLPPRVNADTNRLTTCARALSRSRVGSRLPGQRSLADIWEPWNFRR